VATNSNMRGVTLMELLTVIVVIGILGAIAIPSYRNYLLRAQRTDATAALLRIAAAQEKFYLQNNTYTTVLGSSGLNLSTTTPPTSERGWYVLNIPTASAAAYTATATAPATSPQFKDTDCRIFTVMDTGQRDATNAAGTSNMAACWR
jgi:type IV pilus assembly protein PilE